MTVDEVGMVMVVQVSVIPEQTLTPLAGVAGRVTFVGVVAVMWVVAVVDVPVGVMTL